MHKTLPGLLLALTTTLLASCAPTTVDPAQHKALYPNEPFHVGETWRVTARGGDYSEIFEIQIASRTTPQGAQGVYFWNAAGTANLHFIPNGFSSSQVPPHVGSNWSDGPNRFATCGFLIGNMAPDQTSFSGRYARSLAHSTAYLKTGATEGTGPCTLERVK